jgi:hypothetical protein
MAAKKDGPHLDPNWLREKYHGEELTQAEMAELAGVSQPAVYYQMNRHGVDADTSRGLENRRIPEEDLLDDLRRVVGEVGGEPRVSDYRNRGRYSYQVLHDRFGSWEEALDAVGDATAEGG